MYRSGKNLEAKAGVSGAKAAVAAAEQALMVAKAGLEKDKAMYAYSRMTAPFDGVVTRIDAYGGALLPAGTSSNGDQALCHLSQTDLLRLVIPVPERAVGDVHLGETVAVQISNNSQKLPGKIVRFSGQIDTQTRTMHTEIDVTNPKYELVPGMYATVQIPLHTVHNALTVPTQAVQTSSGSHGTVLVVNTSFKIEKRDVALGLQTATDTEIAIGTEEKRDGRIRRAVAVQARRTGRAKRCNALGNGVGAPCLLFLSGILISSSSYVSSFAFWALPPGSNAGGHVSTDQHSRGDGSHLLQRHASAAD